MACAVGPPTRGGKPESVSTIEHHLAALDLGRDQAEGGRGWVEIVDKGALLTLRGKTGWREVEIGRGSSDASCPIAARVLDKICEARERILFTSRDRERQGCRARPSE